MGVGWGTQGEAGGCVGTRRGSCAASSPLPPAPHPPPNRPARPGPHLQVDEHAAGHVLAGARLGEEGVEGVVAAADGLVGGHLAIGLDAAAAHRPERGQRQAGGAGRRSAIRGDLTMVWGMHSAVHCRNRRRPPRRAPTRAPGSRAPSRRYRPGCRPAERQGERGQGGQPPTLELLMATSQARGSPRRTPSHSATRPWGPGGRPRGPAAHGGQAF